MGSHFENFEAATHFFMPRIARLLVPDAMQYAIPTLKNRQLKPIVTRMAQSTYTGGQKRPFTGRRSGPCWIAVILDAKYRIICDTKCCSPKTRKMSRPAKVPVHRASVKQPKPRMGCASQWLPSYRLAGIPGHDARSYRGGPLIRCSGRPGRWSRTPAPACWLFRGAGKWFP